MINFAREGDTIVVWRLDRLGRNMQDLIQLVNALNKRGGGCLPQSTGKLDAG